MENINNIIDENKFQENTLNLTTPISKSQLKKLKKKENWERIKKEKRQKEKVLHY